MSVIPAEKGRVEVTTREDGKHVVKAKSAHGDLAGSVLTDEQLAMLGRIAVARGVPDAE